MGEGTEGDVTKPHPQRGSGKGEMRLHTEFPYIHTCMYDTYIPCVSWYLVSDPRTFPCPEEELDKLQNENDPYWSPSPFWLSNLLVGPELLASGAGATYAWVSSPEDTSSVGEVNLDC